MIPKGTIFIHIPRTAGRSVCSAMGIKWRPVHALLSEHEEQGEYDPDPAVLKITTVRNPWDRVVSMWRFFGHMTAPKFVKPFPDWLRLKMDVYSRAPDGVVIRPIFNQMLFCRLKDGSIGINRFMRFESIAKDFASVASELGIKPDLPTLGTEDRQMALVTTKEQAAKDFLVSSINDYRSAYTDQSLVDMVAQLDADTIRQFGYTYP